MESLVSNGKDRYSPASVTSASNRQTQNYSSTDPSIQAINRLIQNFPTEPVSRLPPLDSYPSFEGWGVLISVEGVDFEYQFTRDDLQRVFQRYGRLTGVDTLSPQFPFGRVWFVNHVEAERAIHDLDHKVLNGIHGRLRVVWDPYAIRKMQESAVSPSSGVPHPPTPPSVRKFTCRFDIGIENDKDFQVARRIIGQKGANMKRIVEATGAKLRLRGKGSGYLEGPMKEESADALHLCVSCTTMKGYNEALQAMSDILEGVYDEYRKFRRARRLPELEHDLKVVPIETSVAPGGADRALTPQHEDLDYPSSPEHSTIPSERRYDSGYWKVPS